ncbi:DNA polymerase III subunit alpha [candidate division FCPU426 bacterium]|nr:DNA polymerase III subunit alpha [candidate division FCPU426 bacterium]
MLFTHLHVHSYYSLLAGAAAPEELCTRARELGYQALGLTDTNNLSGALAFWQAARETGVRPVFGVQLTQSLPHPWGGPYALVLARDDAGYAKLCSLVSERQLNKKFNLATALGKAGPHVAVIVSDIKLGQAVLAEGRRKVYVEITDAGERPQPGKTSLAIQRAAAAGLAAVFTHPVYFCRPEDHATHCALRAMAEGKTLAAMGSAGKAPGSAYFKSAAELQACFAGYPAVCSRTRQVAEDCQGSPPHGTFRFPAYPCPEGENEFEYLSGLCFAGLKNRYAPVTPLVLRSLAQELEVIENKHFSGYFLAVWDIAAEARRRGIPTVGRGSAANSIVSYCLGITHVDPIKHGLFFERFLNPEKKDPPDIDLDFPWDQRDEMLAYAYQRFGPERVAMVCTTIRLHGRSAVREAGRILGLTEKEISVFSRQFPHSGSVADIAKAKKKIPEARDLPLTEEPWKSVLQMAEKLEGLPRHLSVHPGGIVIAPCPVDQVMPKEMSAKGVVVTQYDMHAVEDAGFVKIDLLGQRGLAVIRDVSKEMKVDWSRVDPYTDEKTRALLRAGKTLGCFYVESPAMRLLLRKLKCDDFGLLVAASSIIRPGVSNSGMMKMFVERHLGRKPVCFAHPCLKDILCDTYGVMVYQEDVIKVVHAVAGMSLGEADALRKCMSKKRHWERMETYQARFFAGAQARGLAEPARKEIWRQIEAFGGYAFCKAHSASYAQLSFQAAYLKAHYPAHFLAAVLSNQGGFYPAAAYLEEARRQGIRLLPPDINESSWRYSVQDKSLRVGLMAVSGLSITHAALLEKNRAHHGRFLSLQDLLARVPLTKEESLALIESGACDGLHSQRTRLAWEWELAQHRQHAGRGVKELPLTTTKVIPCLADATPDEQLAGEFSRMQLSPRAHPLMLFRQSLSALAGPGTVAAEDLARYAGRHVRIYGWLVTWRRTRVHKTGEMMKFITLEDWTDIFEITLFPKAYQQHGHKLFGYGPYLVEGVVKNDRGGITITVENIENLGLGRGFLQPGE